jgi:hypothetical protein
MGGAHQYPAENGFAEVPYDEAADKDRNGRSKKMTPQFVQMLNEGHFGTVVLA